MSENGKRQTEVAVLAGGCFWGVEEILRAVPDAVPLNLFAVMFAGPCPPMHANAVV